MSRNSWSSRRRRDALPIAVLAAVATLSGCARRVVTRPADGLDYVYPAPTEAVPMKELRRTEEAWRAVEIGDVAWAEQRYRDLLNRQPQRVSLRVGLAYAVMRAGRLDEAQRRFAAVVETQPDYVPALVGAAALAARAGDNERALALLDTAALADPAHPVVRRRLAEVKLQIVDRRVADAEAALARGDAATAVAEYRRALQVAPEVGGVRLALADVLIDAGEPWDAIRLLEDAPASDREVRSRLADLLVRTQRFDDALAVFRELLDADPNDRELRARANEARQALELHQMPPPYREIPNARRITRADLAALIAKKITALSRLSRGQAKVATDITASWARPYIVDVVGLGIMTLYPNHTFQPAATVRRGDLAYSLARVMELLGVEPEGVPRITDMSRSHLFYASAERAVAAGLMDVTAKGGFEPWRPVPGEQAVTIVEGLARLVGP